MAKEFVYQMQGLEKFTPDGKKVLDGIWLSFFPGAKIGVIGPNGAGKSTLLRIMAGVDTEFNGETWLDPDATVGYLPQEPVLDESLDVRGNVELGMAHIRDVLQRFEEVSMKFGDVSSDDEMNALIAEQGRLQDEIEAVDGWNLDRTLDIAMDALNLPPGDASVSVLSGGEKRRIALCQRGDVITIDDRIRRRTAERLARRQAELLGGRHTPVACDDGAVLVGQDGVRPAPVAHRGGDLVDLR